MAKRDLTVLVIAGGDSAERDVSLDSGRGIARALRAAGYRVLAADPARPDVSPTEDEASVFGDASIGVEPPTIPDDPAPARRDFVRVLGASVAIGVDVVFNGLHGGAGEDGTVQAVFDYLGIPYTGSGAAACALAMDKQRAKVVASAAGVPVPPGVALGRSALAAGTLEQTVREAVGLPCVVKPNAQGSSVGLTVVASFEQLDEAAARAFALDDTILIEAYIDGREITQGFLAGEPDVPLLEIQPDSGLYDYYHKYQSGSSQYVVPAPVPDAVATAMHESGRRTIDALGLSVYARVDFRLDPDGNHYLLEANTLPGMTATSLVPKAVKHLGIGYEELCDRILRLSLQK
jgi:D-alanine-D-alanine ligase